MSKVYTSKISALTDTWRVSDLVVIGGRPAMGKTALMNSLTVEYAGGNNIPVAIFSLELAAIQLIGRLEKHNIALQQLPLYIDDNPAIDIEYLRIKVRRLCENECVKVVFIDYMQLMQGDELLKSLKSIATEFSITIICLSQLPRCICKREDKRPKVSDLEKVLAGATEYADTILFIYRDGYYDSSIIDDRVEIISAKHDDNSLNSIELRFDKSKGILINE